MAGPIFEISPFGDRWAVTSRDEVLMVTRTKPEARKLAREAAKLLAPEKGPGDGAEVSDRLGEPRSFAPPDG